MAAELRPLGLGELLDRSFTLYREHFWTFVGILAPAQAVGVVAGLLMQWVGLGAIGVTRAQPTANPAAQLALLVPFYLSMLVYGLVSAFAHTAALGASSTALSRIQLGERISIGDAYRSLSGLVARLAGLYGLFILIFIGAYLALVAVVAIPAIGVGMLAVVGLGKTAAAIITVVIILLGFAGGAVVASRIILRYTLSVPALVVERIGPIQALQRSSSLAKGSLGRIFLAGVLMYLIVLVVAFTCETPFWVAGALLGFKFAHNPYWLTAPATVAGGVGGAFGYPLVVIVLPLFYFDARIRKEGFDLQVMMSAPESKPAESAQAPETPAGFQRVSVALVVFFSFVTAAIYMPIWFLTRRAAFNRLRSPEKFGAAIFVALTAVFAISFLLDVAAPFAGARKEDLDNLSRVLSLGAGISLLIQSFKARRMIEEHVNAGRRRGALFVQPESVNGVAVFFFGIFYLQYKINRLLAEVNASHAAETAISGPAFEPGLAMPPQT